MSGHVPFLPIEPVYERLAESLDALPNAYVRTASGVELQVLKRIFSLQEAELAAGMGREAETAATIAARHDLLEKDAAAMLKAMAKRGLVWPEFDRARGTRKFRLAPFIVGIFEAQLELMDHDLSHLIEQYMDEGGAAALMGSEPALHRVVPAEDTAPRDWVLPYDDVVEIVSSGSTFVVRDCICRVQRGAVHGRCQYPLEMCLTISPQKRPARPGDLSLDEALALIRKAEDVGLVHCVSNVAKGFYYVCNCCGCCCGFLRAINERGVANAVARSNYRARVDEASCTGCEACLSRCQVSAISIIEGQARVDAARCIGCGLCLAVCNFEALELERLPEAEAIHPPADYAAWEEARLAWRAAHQGETHSHDHSGAEHEHVHPQEHEGAVS